MALRFVWDPRKAAANHRRHGVDFAEAATAFGDPLSLTVLDPDHSESEERFILMGRSERDRLLVVVHVERAADEIRIISARRAAPHERLQYEEDSKKGGKTAAKRSVQARVARDVPMRAEYDFSGAVRNKYAKRFAAGSNVVVLEPDVAQAFPTAKSVNAALRRALDGRPAKRGGGSKRRSA